jgi:hypothetical protein
MTMSALKSTGGRGGNEAGAPLVPSLIVAHALAHSSCERMTSLAGSA